MKLHPDDLLTIELVLATHALWITVPKAGAQPDRCPCGHKFKLGESFVRHQTDEIVKALAYDEVTKLTATARPGSSWCHEQ